MRPRTCALRCSLREFRQPKDLNSWPILWFQNCILQKPTLKMNTELPKHPEAGRAGGAGVGSKTKQTMRNFESLTTPQGSSKSGLPSLELVVTAQHRFWVLYFASLLSTMGHVNGKRIFVSEFIYSCCLQSLPDVIIHHLWQKNFVQSN